MSETISGKLRSAANGLGSFKTTKGDFGLADEAADELDRLRAENERLREALEKIAGPGKSYLNDAGNFRRCQDEALAALKANGGKE